jgi:ABC-2 type transport system ATP-binding protein
MRQRLGIAASLLRAPRLLLLDEPTTGLDPAGMRDMRALVRRLADSGMTVVLSSHLLGEVEEVCDRVAIIRTGRVVYEGAIAELKRSAVVGYRVHTTDDARALAVCAAQAGVTEARTSGGAVRFAASEEVVADLSVALVEAGLALLELVPETASLEDLFFRLTEGTGEAETPGSPAPSAAAVGEAS